MPRRNHGASDEGTYRSVRITTLCLAESVERFRLVADRASQFLVLSLGTFAALDRTMLDVIAQLQMMSQIHNLLVRIGRRGLDSFAYGATDPEKNSARRNVLGFLLGGEGG